MSPFSIEMFPHLFRISVIFLVNKPSNIQYLSFKVWVVEVFKYCFTFYFPSREADGSIVLFFGGITLKSASNYKYPNIHLYLLIFW